MTRFVLLLPLVLLAACGARSAPSMPQNDGGLFRDVHATPRPDYGAPRPDVRRDAYVPPPDTWWIDDAPMDGGGCSATINSVCHSDADCCGSLECVALASGVSVCSRRCTPDDPETPLTNEDDCPNNWELSCADIAPYGGGSFYCLRRCKPQLFSNACPDGIACHPQDNQLDWDLQTSSCARPMCTADADCPVFVDKTCFNDQECGSVMVCREDQNAVVPLRRCAMPGLCDRASGLCRPASLAYNLNARVGDPCESDLSCNRGMRCELPYLDASGGFSYARNGYCMIDGCLFGDGVDHLRCPAGSTCHRLYPGGRCFATCTPGDASSCRNRPEDRYGDYECYNWNYLYADASMQPIAAQPTCEPAVYTCDYLYPLVDCSAIGEQGNPFGMSCRDPATGKTLPEGSPQGVCLDQTASGAP